MNEHIITLEERVRVYAREKAERDAVQAMLDARHAEFEEENADLIAELRARNEDLKRDDTIIRDQAVEEFKATGVKKLGGGVGIRETKRTEYNAADARAWAQEKRPDLIALDAKAYEKVLKSDGRDPSMPGNVVLVPSATIPTDLSAYLD